MGIIEHTYIFSIFGWRDGTRRDTLTVQPNLLVFCLLIYLVININLFRDIDQQPKNMESRTTLSPSFSQQSIDI